MADRLDDIAARFGLGPACVREHRQLPGEERNEAATGSVLAAPAPMKHVDALHTLPFDADTEEVGEPSATPWYGIERTARSAYRAWNIPTGRNYSTGFRLVRSFG